MIYLITNQTRLETDDTVYKLASLNDVYDYFKNHTHVAVDCETTGFDPHTTEMLSIQLGDQHNQFVIDALTVNIRQLKSFLESKILIGHNFKFDLKFLYKKDIYPMNIWDTYVTEKVIHCGYTTIRNALDKVVERYLGVILDKSVRADIAKEGLTTRVIKYDAADVAHLHQVMELQKQSLLEKDLSKVVYIENRFTPALAYIEYCGFKLDREKWKKKMDEDQKIFNEAEMKLDLWVLNNNLPDFINKQLDLFEPVSCNINWSSSKQVTKLFEQLGVNCSYYDKGILKKSVDAKIIKKEIDKSPVVKLYLDYKKAEKVVTTYGDTFLKQINTNTKRIHTSFQQVMETGRISSGGKDKITKAEYINFQNIPADPLTRSCFVASPGHVLVCADYSGQEQIVLANKSLDRALLEFYDKKLYEGDMHTFVTTRIWPELDGLTLAQIKKDHKDKRDKAKTAGFAINYGGVGQTIANNLNLTKEEGDVIYDAYFKVFPDLKIYFEKIKKRGLKDGYILISELSGRKCFIEFFDKYKELEDEIFSPGFWESYRHHKSNNTPQFLDMKQVVSDYFNYKGTIERMSLNYPIQGSSAEITKISCILIYEYIVKNDLLNIVKFVNTVHDENVLEVPLDRVDEMKEVVEKSMKTAADLYCKRVSLKAEAETSTYWRK